jgi:hypothetical protein
MQPLNLKHCSAALVGALIFAAGSAHAGLFRTYLSVNGNDANPCTVGAPCRLLPAALTAVNDGGEIWIVDSANFNTGTVGITKSVTILAIPAALGSVVANNADAISINTAGAKVTLRNLVLLNLAGVSNKAINFAQGSELTVESCEVYGMGSDAIVASAAGSKVVIKDSTVRDGASSAMKVSGSVVAKLSGVQALNNGTYGLWADTGAQVSVGSSVLAGNGSGGLAATANGGTTRVALVNSELSGNGVGLTASTAIASDAVQVTLVDTAVSQNVTTGINVSQVASSSASVTLEHATVTQNATGVNLNGSGVAYSMADNVFKYNTTDVAGGSLTALAGQ